MFAVGFAELVFLSLLAGSAALSWAIRIRFEGRAELAVATGILWNAVIAFPIYALSLFNVLDARNLAWASGLLSIALLASSWLRRAPGDELRTLLRVASSLCLLPWHALRDVWRARSLVLVGLLVSVLLVEWTAISSYFGPSWRQWDALWYHEPIVGFTLQNHGFSVVPLPPGLQKINGYPRLCEMTQLWFVIFTDRRIIELANSVIAPFLMLVVYLLTLRLSKDRVTSIGWATVVLIMPGCSILLQSTYVDLHTAFLVLAAAHFCTRAPLRLRDVAFAAGCLAMGIAAKILALVPIGMLTVIVLVRALWGHVRTRTLATLATALGGAAMMAGAASMTYLRNWIHFHNPLWPDLVFDSPRFGIHWEGVAYGGNPLDLNQPLGTFFDNFTSIPYSRALGHVTQIYEYGFAVAWFAAPLAVLSSFAVVIVAFRSLVGRVFKRPQWRMSQESFTALLLVVPFVACVAITPALWGARYHIVSVGLATALIAWAGGRPGFGRFAEGAVTVVMLGTIVAFYWQPRWWYTPSELLALSRIPFPERESTPATKLSLALSVNSGSAITPEMGLAREKTLGAGAVVAFDDAAFPALLWNNQFSNKLVYVAPGPEFVARVEQTGAIWLYCKYGNPCYAPFAAADSGWVDAGPLNVEHWGSIFRRVRW